jgi:hypothetical protein
MNFRNGIILEGARPSDRFHFRTTGRYGMPSSYPRSSGINAALLRDMADKTASDQFCGFCPPTSDF